MRSTRWLSAGGLALLFAASAGCHKGTAAPSPDGSPSAALGTASAASPGGNAAGACDVVSCLNFSGSPGYVAAQATDLSDVPPPPPGAVLCGGTKQFRANYYTTSQKPEDVIAHYEKLLPPQGFTLKPHAPGNKPCSVMVSFHKKSLEIGNVIAYVGGFSVSYFGK